MLTYRPFRNTDPPAISEIWRSRTDLAGLAQPISVELLERFVFARLYFDYPGLIIARDDERPVGFAHAGYGPNAEENNISTEMGTTNLLLLRAEYAEQLEVASGLLEESENYLRAHGTRVMFGGGIRPLNGFYFGLYGGSVLPGVLASDALAQQLYPAHGYQEIDRTLLWQRDLANFEAPMERRQMQIRRQMIVEVTPDPPPRTWWDACITVEFELTRFDLVPRGGGPPVGSAVFRGMELTPCPTGSTSLGLIDLEIDPSQRGRGLATFLVSEALRQFSRQGALTVQAQAMQHNIPIAGLLRKLGFQQVGEGSVFRKEV
jgi:GNAT superfamily N-acetyltransferase